MMILTIATVYSVESGRLCLRMGLLAMQTNSPQLWSPILIIQIKEITEKLCSVLAVNQPQEQRGRKCGTLFLIECVYLTIPPSCVWQSLYIRFSSPCRHRQKSLKKFLSSRRAVSMATTFASLLTGKLLTVIIPNVYLLTKLLYLFRQTG